MQFESLVFTDHQGWGGTLPVHLDGPSTWVLVFASPQCAGLESALEALRRGLPRSRLAGCSTAGEIRAGEVLDGSLTATVVRFDTATLQDAATALQGAGDSFAAGRRLGAALPREGLRAVLLLSEGVNVNGARLVEGVTEVLGPGVAVLGGLAGDGDRFAQTWVLVDGRPARGMAAVVGLYGEALRIGTGFGGGWSAFGPARRITRAQGQVLYELDGRPALALYKDYLGEFARGLPGSALRFPLQVRAAQPGAEPLVRTVLGVDEASQSMTFAGDIPEGGTAVLMRANHAGLVDAAAHAAEVAAQQAGRGRADEPALVLAVSCVGRRMILGEHTDEELEAVAQGVPARCAQTGFYSYGEIVPAGGAVSRLHNQTIGVTVLREERG